MSASPDFELIKYVDQSTDESYVYGFDHQFTYESGDISNPYGHRVAIVELKVGGQIRHEDPKGKIAIKGFMAFPPNGATMDAELVLDDNPDHEQMLEISCLSAALLISGTALLKNPAEISN